MSPGLRLVSYARRGFTLRVYRHHIPGCVRGPPRPSLTVPALADVVAVRRPGPFGLRRILANGTEATYQAGAAADELRALLAQLS